MKYLSYKDRLRRKFYFKTELERYRLRSICSNERISAVVRSLYALRLHQFSKNSSKCRIKNRCLVTGRGQSVYRFFRLNRSTIREFFAQDMLNGIKKSSW
jgi:small subunit ribosomal protein S14